MFWSNQRRRIWELCAVLSWSRAAHHYSKTRVRYFNKVLTTSQLYRPTAYLLLRYALTHPHLCSNLKTVRLNTGRTTEARFPERVGYKYILVSDSRPAPGPTPSPPVPWLPGAIRLQNDARHSHSSSSKVRNARGFKSSSPPAWLHLCAYHRLQASHITASGHKLHPQSVQLHYKHRKWSQFRTS
jgi:hypothetical protein